MRLQGYLFCLLAIVSSARGQIPEQYSGNWLLVNGVEVVLVETNGTMTVRNSGLSGKLSLKDDGTFTWETKPHARSGKFSEGKLYLKSETEAAPEWVSYLEFRRGKKEVADELIEFALRQQTASAAKTVKFRRKLVEDMMTSNLRVLDGAAAQYFIENGVKSVKFDQIVGPGKLIEKLTPADDEDYSKLDLTQGVTWKLVGASGVTVSYDFRR